MATCRRDPLASQYDSEFLVVMAIFLYRVKATEKSRVIGKNRLLFMVETSVARFNQPDIKIPAATKSIKSLVVDFPASLRISRFMATLTSY